MVASPLAQEAREVAGRAAAVAGVEMRELYELVDLRAVRALYDQIWGFGPTEAPVTVEQLRPMTHAGNYAAGAYAGGELVGAAVGFLAAPAGAALHSHVVGVLPDARSRGVGFALKLHQRAWALERGLREVTWTFDPLLRRNAHFNLARLGARPREYLVDFYGDMDDTVNSSQGSDRLLVAWELADPAVVAACRGEPAAVDTGTAAPALAASPERDPRPARARSGTVLVDVPAGIEQLRERDPRAGPALAAGGPRRARRPDVRRRAGDRVRPHGRVRGGAVVAAQARAGGGRAVVTLAGVELRRVAMPLVAPFRTSFGTETARDVLLVRVVTEAGEGWGECVAPAAPHYSSEYAAGAADVMRRFLVPRLLAADRLEAHRVEPLLAPVRGHRMAKAALEMAVLDAQLRATGEPLARHLGAVRDRVPAGVSVGIAGSVPELLDTVASYLDHGYVRIKLKIEPGWDVAPVRRCGSGSGTGWRCRWTPTPRTHWRTPAPSLRWTRSTCC